MIKRLACGINHVFDPVEPWGNGKFLRTIRKRIDSMRHLTIIKHI